MSLASEAWRQSVALNNRLLEQLEARRRELQKAQRAAHIAFDAAKEDLDAVKNQMDDTLSQLKKLRVSNRKLQGRLASRVFQQFPLELLRMIFLELQFAVEQPNNLRSEPVTTPFTLASVCSKWRSLALRTARLWACIYVYVLEEKKLHPYAFERVRAMVHRSKDAALDIRLIWDHDTELAWAPTDDTPESKILSLLGTHCARWRRFDIHLPDDTIPLAALDIFRAATPQLEEVLIAGPEFTSEWSPDAPNFFPFCPKLRSFRAIFANIVPSAHNAPFKSIQQLELAVQMPAKVLWATLRLVAPSLQSLDIHLPSEPEGVSQALSSRIVFDRLQSLTVNSSAVPLYAPGSGMVSFPNLTSLVASSEALPMLLPLWENTPNKISSIIIQHEGDPPTLGRGNALSLRAFPTVNQLTIRHDCVVTGDFLSALAERGADGKWILPALVSFTFGFNTTLEAAHGEALVSLLRARQDAARDGGPGSPCRISDVAFSYADVPDWVESQVRCILTTGAP